MLASVAVQPSLMSSELVPIGEAAARFGLRASALRYYEDRGLVTPTARPGGRRCYDRAQLRRIAFVQIGRRLGMRLDQLGEILDGPEHRWRVLVEGQIVTLDEQIARIRRARAVLTHALECPTTNPVRECAQFIAELDRLAAAGVDEINIIMGPDAEQHGGP